MTFSPIPSPEPETSFPNHPLSYLLGYPSSIWDSALNRTHHSPSQKLFFLLASIIATQTPSFYLILLLPYWMLRLSAFFPHYMTCKRQSCPVKFRWQLAFPPRSSLSTLYVLILWHLLHTIFHTHFICKLIYKLFYLRKGLNYQFLTHVYSVLCMWIFEWMTESINQSVDKFMNELPTIKAR